MACVAGPSARMHKVSMKRARSGGTVFGRVRFVCGARLAPGSLVLQLEARLLQRCCNSAATTAKGPANRLRGFRGLPWRNSCLGAGISRFFAVARSSGEGGIRTHEAP
jgi:hypothetical protein